MTADPSEPSRGAEAATSKALELLARRAHFRSQLAAKLAARGFPPAAVQEALDGLCERGYLDDRAAARQWAEGAARHHRYGPRRLRAELLARGVEAEVADEAVAAALGAGEREQARAAAARFRGSDPAALARHLDRKGFSKPIILEIVRGFGGEAADPDPEP